MSDEQGGHGDLDLRLGARSSWLVLTPPRFAWWCAASSACLLFLPVAPQGPIPISTGGDSIRLIRNHQWSPRFAVVFCEPCASPLPELRLVCWYSPPPCLHSALISV